MSVLAIVFYIACGGWITFEVIFGLVKKSSDKSKDQGSQKYLWLTILLSIVAAYFIAYHVSPAVSFNGQAVGWIAVALILIGLALRLSAVFSLGEYFTSNVTTRDGQTIITKGLYKYIRHPAYAGSLVSFFGLGLGFGNLLSLLVIFIPVTVAFLYRIKIEERVLLEEIGEPYRQYMETRARLIPYIY